jgi:hypothetical protein
MNRRGPSGKFVYSVIRKRAPLFALAFAVLFTVIAVVQYLFVQRGVYSSAQDQLKQWADQIVVEIGYKDKWDLTAYRQSASVQAPSAFVFASDGTIIETKGFIPGLVGKVKLFDHSIFQGPTTVTAPETGETWREFGVKVAGGFVALGILNFRDITAPDELLKSTAQKFGSTIEQALKVRTSQTSSEVDFAIVDDSGNLVFAAEGLPLKTSPAAVAELANSHRPVRLNEKAYLLFARNITDPHGNAVGTVIVPKDVTAEEAIIHRHIAFNAATTVVAWLVALLVVVSYLAVDDWRSRPQPMSLEEALKTGESQTVEFKGGQPDVPLKQAIAAFANTNSGTIFIGVDNTPKVVGAKCNTPHERDQELLRIQKLTRAIKPSVYVSVDFLEHQGMTVTRIFVPRSQQAIHFVDDEIYVRDQATSTKATPEQVERIMRKFYR